MRLDGKTPIVTGAGSGRAIAGWLAGDVARVVVVGRDTEKLRRHW